ncbi:4Fe-4S ferredoxin [Candidatus Bathyarchaeota archaeon]|nr:MAG: 4Fe-4S ferredoxin [Candidatus Bathyarchaeota archaeon]
MPVLHRPGLRASSWRKISKLVAFLACNMGFSLALKTGGVIPFMYCHGCPLAAFACPIGALQHFIGLGEAPLLVAGSLILAFLLLGRSACGWLCPFGALQDLLARPGEAGARQDGRWDVKLRYLKLLILLGALSSSFALSGPTFCWVCPIGALFAGIPYLLAHPGWRPGPAFYIHMAILVLVLLLAVRIPRAWCRYLCPLGAISGCFNKVSLLGIELDEARCTRCLACLRACPMGLTSLGQIGSSPECVLCAKCLDACPSGALKATFRTGIGG